MIILNNKNYSEMYLITSKIKEWYPDFIPSDNIILSMNELFRNFFSNQDAIVSNAKVSEFFSFINSFNNETNEVLELIEVGFLEMLTDSLELQKIGFQNLNGKILERFNALFNNKFRKLI